MAPLASIETAARVLDPAALPMRVDALGPYDAGNLLRLARADLLATLDARRAVEARRR